MKDEGCEYVSSIENAQGETLASLVYWILRNSLTFSPFFFSNLYPRHDSSRNFPSSFDRYFFFYQIVVHPRDNSTTNNSTSGNDAKNRLIREHEEEEEETKEEEESSSRTLPSDNKGLCRLPGISFYLVTVSAKPCRGNSNRGGPGTGTRRRRRGRRSSPRDARRRLAKVLRVKLFASNNF